MKLNLNLDEKDILVDFAQGDTWPVLHKAIVDLVERQERAVLSHNIEDGVDRLVHAKLRAEGARRLANDVEQLLKLLMKKG